VGSKQEGFHFPDFYSSALSTTGQYANRFIARDGQDIRVLMGFQPVALRVTQDALQVSQRPAARLGTSKAWGNPGMQTRKDLDPATDSGGGRGLVSACDRVILLHLLLLSASALWFAVSHLQSVTSARRRGDFFTRFRSLLSS
jgi:hypothetical protein